MKIFYSWVAWLCLLLNANHVTAQSVTGLNAGDQLTGPAWETIPNKENKKLIILDFWSTWCTSCIAAFPKMEKLQEEFSKDIQIVLVNSFENEDQVQNRFKIFNANLKAKGKKDRINPDLPMINGDSVLRNLFPHNSVPHHVWLDGKGKVLAITNGHNATSINIRKVINGDNLAMSNKRDLKAEGYDPWEKGLINKGHESLQLSYYTSFFMYHSGMPSGNSTQIDTLNNTFRRSWFNASPIILYNSIKFNLSKRIRSSVELKNKEAYEWPKGDNLTDEWLQNNVFSYEMLIPLDQKDSLGLIMLPDLNRFFGKKLNIEGVIEKRKLDAWVLKLSNPNLLKTSGKEKKYSKKQLHRTFINYPFGLIVNSIRNALEDMDIPVIFEDETLLDPSLSVDMQLDLDKSEIPRLIQQFKKYGLLLEKTSREVEVLTIKDKN